MSLVSSWDFGSCHIYVSSEGLDKSEQCISYNCGPLPLAYRAMYHIYTNLISVYYRNLTCFNRWQLYISSKFNVSQCGRSLTNHWPQGFIPINTRQQRASLPFKPGQGHDATVVISASSLHTIELNYLELCSVNAFCWKGRYIQWQYNILLCVLTFAKPECDNPLQPLRWGMQPSRLVQHIITLWLGKWWGLQHIITLGLGKHKYRKRMFYPLNVSTGEDITNYSLWPWMRNVFLAVCVIVFSALFLLLICPCVHWVILH